MAGVTVDHDPLEVELQREAGCDSGAQGLPQLREGRASRSHPATAVPELNLNPSNRGARLQEASWPSADSRATQQSLEVGAPHAAA